MQIDVRGLSCPLPLMRTKKALEARPAALTVLVTSGTAKANVAALLEDEGFAVRIAERDGEWRIEARRP
jgi:tRNA 2-thiouridine synthesizing protein A